MSQVILRQKLASLVISKVWVPIIGELVIKQDSVFRFLRFFGQYVNANDATFIVMELFESGSLLDYMVTSPYESIHFTNEEVRNSFRILAGGLVFLHEDRGIVHGDLALR